MDAFQNDTGNLMSHFSSGVLCGNYCSALMLWVNIILFSSCLHLITGSSGFLLGRVVVKSGKFSS